jgi:hypothetical protein
MVQSSWPLEVRPIAHAADATDAVEGPRVT